MRVDTMHTKTLSTALFAALLATAQPFAFAADPPAPAPAQQPQARPANPPRRPAPQARDPHAPGYVEAKELADGEVPPVNVDGNFIVGPTHKKAPEMIERPDTPKGTVKEFVMKSEESKM